MQPLSPQFGKYELLAHLATGGMAEIYLARMTGASGFSKLVVVKRLLPHLAGDKQYVQMFLDEARINAQLSHSNIVQVLDLGETDGQYYMAMEYVAGLSVAQVGRMSAQRLGAVPQAVACGIVLQACAGLHRAHETKLPDGGEMGIIHRDVSPQNLLLTYEGFVKVLDFGIAKAEGRETKTQAGTVKGKFAYMSPEQCVGEPLDRRTDVFALGIILFELCTSRRLFKRQDTFETYEAIIKGDVPDPSTVSDAVTPQVSAVILKALARKKEDRYLTAEAMQEALEQAMRRSGIRGKSTDLARFLEQHFADSIKEQEELIQRIESGAFNDGEQDTQGGALAENYAALIEDELVELDESEGPPTQSEGNQPEAAPEHPPSPAPPAKVPLATRPVSMALPIIDRNQIVADILAGKKPAALGGGSVEVRPATPSQPVASPPGRANTPSAPALPPEFALSPPRGASLPAPSPQPVGAPPPPGALMNKLASLPLLYLILIGIALAGVGAGLTALVLF